MSVTESITSPASPGTKQIDQMKCPDTCRITIFRIYNVLRNCFIMRFVCGQLRNRMDKTRRSCPVGPGKRSGHYKQPYLCFLSFWFPYVSPRLSYIWSYYFNVSLQTSPPNHSEVIFKVSEPYDNYNSFWKKTNGM